MILGFFELLTPSSVVVMSAMLTKHDIDKIHFVVSREGRFLENITDTQFKQVFKKVLEVMLVHYLMYMPVSHDEYIQLMNSNANNVLECIKDKKILKIFDTYKHIDKTTPIRLVNQLTNIIDSCYPIEMPTKIFKDIWEPIVYDTYRHLSKHIDIRVLQTTMAGEPVSTSIILKHIKNLANYLTLVEKGYLDEIDLDIPIDFIIKVFINDKILKFHMEPYKYTVESSLWQLNSMPVHYGNAVNLSEIKIFINDVITNWLYNKIHEDEKNKISYPFSVLLSYKNIDKKL